MRVLNAEFIRQNLDAESALELARQAVLLSDGDRHKTPLRNMMTLPTGAGLMACMPGWIADPDRFGIKLVNIFPGNTAIGLSSHVGAVLLFDGARGETLAVLDASTITAVRTAAVTAVATEILACENAKTLGILGTGEQAVEHIRLLSMVRPFTDIFILGSSPEKTEAFIARQQDQSWLPQGCRLHFTDSAEALSAQAEVICTVTSSQTPLLDPAWLRAGQHINAVGASDPSAMEITPEHVIRGRYFVDSLESLEAEAGEYRALAAQNAAAAREVEGVLGGVLAGRIAGRGSDADITIYRSLGIAVQDMVFASFLYDRAMAEGSGQVVDF